MDEMSVLGLIAVLAFLAGAVWLGARLGARLGSWLPWRIEAHRARVPQGCPVSQLELRVARRAGARPGWRLYCSIVLARGQDQPILSGQPPAQGL